MTPLQQIGFVAGLVGGGDKGALYPFPGAFDGVEGVAGQAVLGSGHEGCGQNEKTKGG